jgi:flavin-dependent dehydrogenase
MTCRFSGDAFKILAQMGMVGTVSARDCILLVGDAAGLVNPLQGEGIAPAIASAATGRRLLNELTV